MSPFLSVTALLLAASVVFMLPLVPALLELHRKSDASPLSVIQQHAGEIRYFADGFRSYIKGLEPLLRESVSSGAATTGMLPGGTEYLVLGRGDDLKLPLKESDELCPVLIAASTDLLLPSETTFSKDIYAGGRFIGGTKNRYRAILGEKDVHLSAESSVMRWVHAVGEFWADQDCKLHGRVSSDGRIRLQRGCTFQRLNAPCVEFGGTENSIERRPERIALATETACPQRLLHDGDFEIPAGETFHGNLVVRGCLSIGSGARVDGSVKGGKDVVIGCGASVAGSLIAVSKMRIAADCVIHGPVISEHLLLIEKGSRCGSPETPTTVSAPWIQVEEGAVVFGTLWAREQGQVVEQL